MARAFSPLSGVFVLGALPIFALAQTDMPGQTPAPAQSQTSAPAQPKEPASPPSMNQGAAEEQHGSQPSSDTAKQDDTKPEAEKTAATPHKSMARGHEESVEQREVMALNTLEAQGYNQFKGLHPDGQNIAATAQKNGKDVQVVVTPSGQVQSK